MDTGHWSYHANLDSRFRELVEKNEEKAASRWKLIDQKVFINQARVLEAFRQERIGEEDFHESTGYGYNDVGREKLESIYARVFGGESALVRPHFVSGTHALAVTLFALLRPGERLLSVTGPPYDTLQKVIGHNCREKRPLRGTLKDLEIHYDELPLDSSGYPRLELLKSSLASPVKAALIQRSPGYNSSRSTLTIEKIKQAVKAIGTLSPETLILIDNCYGEFVETSEPLEVGAHLMVGSLIKNPGGGLAPGGGYVVGRRDLVKQVSIRLYAPGLEEHLGAMGSKRPYFMGFFNAPNLVGNALKTVVFAAALFADMGFEVSPEYNQERGDLVQAIRLGNPDLLNRFCSAVQQYSPVDSHVGLEAARVPGYRDRVIMAAGTFIQGASGELSADAPLRPPYTVFLQGGLTLAHGLLAVCKAGEEIYLRKAKISSHLTE